VFFIGCIYTMSVIALKRKTFAQYKNNSAGQPQFSINGPYRSQGFVGQTSLSRSLSKTIMKGNVAKGHGGCCGKYTQSPIVQTAVISLEDTSVVKSSVLSTPGLIRTKYRWMRRPAPFSTTKSFDRNNTQGEYLFYLQQQVLSEKKEDGTPCDTGEAKSFVVRCNNGRSIGLDNAHINAVSSSSSSRLLNLSRGCRITKPEEATGAVNGSKHVSKLNKKCFNVDDFKTTTQNSGAPFTC
jgi:hypothetical protein